MNKVKPIPIRAAFTGFEDSLEDGPDGPDGPDGFPVCFSGGFVVPLEPPDCFGRLLLGLAALPEVAGFSFGRVVKNAPRTSSSCIAGAALPITTAQRQTNPKAITLNLISESPCCSPCQSKFCWWRLDVPAKG